MKKFVVAVMLVAVLCAGAFAEESADIFGENHDKTYTNTVMGATAAFGKNWKIFSREEIAAFARAMSSSSSLTEKEILDNNLPLFVATLGEGIMNVNITVDRIDPMSKALIAKSRDMFVELFSEHAAASLVRANTESGIKDINVKKVTLFFLGAGCPGVYMTAKARDIPIFQKQAIHITEDYIFYVTATSLIKDKTDDILNRFERIQ